MQFVGGIEGMDYKPITGYNAFLKGSASFDVNQDINFEQILQKQAELNKKQMSNPNNIQVNSDFDSIMANVGSSNKSKSALESFAQSFSQSFSGGINSVNDSATAANKAQEAFAMGEDVSVHDVMIAAEKANLSMQMAIQLRNKIINAYTEINNVKV